MRSVFLAILCASALGAEFGRFPASPDGDILTWLIAGPFAPGEFDAAELVGGGLPCEGDAAGAAAWAFVLAGDGGIVDLEARWPRDHVAAFAACGIEAPEAQKAVLAFGSDDACKVWLNDALVLETPRSRALTRNRDSVAVDLRKGVNTLYVQITETVGGWGFQGSVKPAAGAVRIVLPLREAPDPLRWSFQSVPFARRAGDKAEPIVWLHVEWLGDPVKAAVEIAAGNTLARTEIELEPGRGTFALPVPSVPAKTAAKARIAAGAVAREAALELAPVKPLEVFIVQHTHTDIGYTADQPEIQREHLRFIDEALAAVDATRGYPEHARFKWVCEAAWGVELYLDNRPPAAAAKLLAAAREGAIELTGLSLNMTDLADEEVLIRGLQPLARLRRARFDIACAMQNDVNGFPWALPRLLRSAGIRYFSNGINETRSKVPFDHPRALWWESPDGSALLTWRGWHYMAGNFMGLNEDFAAAERKVGDFLAPLNAPEYPHAVVLAPLSGLFTDNGPPSTFMCDLVARWNEKYAWPHLRIATLKEFFTALEEREGARIPRIRKAWCDWWADGIAAGADECAIVKASQESLRCADTLAALAGAGLGDGGAGLRAELAGAYRHCLLYDEHTYGAWNSIEDPGSLRAKHGWLYKSSFAAAAGLGSARAEDAALAGLLWNLATGPDPTLVAFNPLPWPRACPLKIKLPRNRIERMRPFKLIENEGGAELPYQIVGEETLWLHLWAAAPEVPACGYRTWRIVPGAPAEVPNPFAIDGTTISNGRVAVAVDAATGAIAGLSIDGRELVGEASAPHGFGGYIYEEIADPAGRGMLWPRRDKVAFTRRALAEVSVERGLAGPVAASLIVRGRIAPDHRVACEITLWRDAPWAELAYTLRKPRTATPEAVYIAFPFHAPPLRAEIVGGLLEPGRGQIPRSAMDWHAIQDHVLAGTPGGLAAWVTHDAPLVQFGAINTGKYLDMLAPAAPVVYSWPINNYWFTNFPAEQGGEFRFRYSVGAPADDAAGHRFAKERVAFARTAVAPPRRAGALPAEGASLLQGDECLHFVKPAEDGGGFVLRFRNLSAAPRTAAARFSPLLRIAGMRGVDVLEQPAEVDFVWRDGTLTVPLAPHAAAEIMAIVP